MLLKEIIERIDKSEKNRNCIDLEALAYELGINFGYTDVDDKDVTYLIEHQDILSVHRTR